MASLRAIAPFALAAALAPSAVAAKTPMAYFTAHGEMGARIAPLLHGLAYLAIAVVVVISGLVLIAVIRRGRRAVVADVPLLDSHETQWISIGVGVSTLILIAYVTWTSIVMARIANPPSVPALTIEVDGHQWWWEAVYQNTDPSQVFTTANEIHVPVGKPVRIELKSADVIHTFWVPSLAGKTQMIPGQTNVTWLEASRPGVYRGQCSQYCGMQHANMIFYVHADPPDSFELWRKNQLRATAEPADAEARAGEERFIQRCGACHTVRGTRAAGRVGPDLTHLLTRDTIAGILRNGVGFRDGWIASPQHFKPGAYMPDPDLSGPDLAAIGAFLATLK
jgi:cytochrome c oxidase subunit 2